MQLEEVDYKQFKKIVGRSYKKDFPREERMKFHKLEREYKKGNLTFVFLKEEAVYAYAILIKEREYLLIFYLATFSQERGKGYGSKMLQLLRDKYPNNTIFIEVERSGYGKNEQENKVRENRIDFYKRNNFIEINTVGKIWKTEYELYVMKSDKDNSHMQEKIVEIEMQIYIKLFGKKLTQKFVKLGTKEKENIY